MKNDYLKSIQSSSEYKSIINKLNQMNASDIYPKDKNYLRCLELCKFEDIKVVIVGQDPYHSPKVADGLAFSTKEAKTPPSLKNMFLELKRSYPQIVLETNSLDDWAKQGVLLINRVFSVEKAKPGSHKQIGWEKISQRIIQDVNDEKEKVIFVLWGQKAQELAQFINQDKHYILQAAHPSPFSAYRGFIGNNHFRIINDILEQNKQKQIDWNLKKG